MESTETIEVSAKVRPVIRSATLAISEKAIQEVKQHLGIGRCYSIFNAKLSLLLDPEAHCLSFPGDAASLIKKTTLQLLIVVPASEVPDTHRKRIVSRQTSNFDAPIPVAIVLISSAPDSESSSQLDQLLEKYKLPTWRVAPNTAGPVIDKLRWLDIETLHSWSKLRAVVNPWHLDVLQAAAAIGGRYGLRVVAEVGLDHLVDLDRYFQQTVLDVGAKSFLRHTTVDVVICSDGPISLPLAAIHIDSHHHDNDKSRRNDNVVNVLMKSTGLLTLRARLDGGRTTRRPTRSYGPGDRDYWERVYAAVLAVCEDAGQRLIRLLNDGAVRDVIEDLVSEVARHDLGLSKDLDFLLNMQVVHLDKALRDSATSAPSSSEEDWKLYEDPLETQTLYAMWDDERDEDQLLKYGPRALLEVDKRKEKDSNGRWFIARLLTRNGEPLPDVPQIRRHVPKGAVAFRGIGANAVRAQYDKWIWRAMEQELFERAASYIETHADTIGKAAQIRRKRRDFNLELARWKRLSLNDREKEIRRKMKPSRSWLEKQVDAPPTVHSFGTGPQEASSRGSIGKLNSPEWLNHFYDRDVAIFDDNRAKLSDLEREALTGRLERERDRLLALIHASEAPEDERELLQDITRSEFEDYQRLVLEGQ